MKINIGLGYSPFGETDFFVDFDRHAIVLGKTGVGKSTLLFNVAVKHVRAGHGLTVLDPHGDLIDSLLEYIPLRRLRDVILIDPKAQRIPGINILEGKDPDLAVDTLTSIIKSVWPDGWGPQTDRIISNLSKAVILKFGNDATALYVYKALLQKECRGKLKTVQDGAIQDFFKEYDEAWDSKQRNLASAPPINKLGKFAGKDALKLILGQENPINFREAIEKKRIILARLPKGSLGPDVASILGSVILSKIALAAFEREDTPYSKRTPHLLIADEVHSFSKGMPLDVVLSEARKYRLSLLVATQTVAQLPTPEAVFGNVNTIIAYRLGGDDAATIAGEFGRQFPATAILTVPNYQFYATTVSGEGIPTDPKIYRAFETLPKIRPVFHEVEKGGCN